MEELFCFVYLFAWIIL